MKQQEFVKLMQGALFVFEGSSDSDLLLKKGYSYQEILKSKKIKIFVEEFEDE